MIKAPFTAMVSAAIFLLISTGCSKNDSEASHTPPEDNDAQSDTHTLETGPTPESTETTIPEITKIQFQLFGSSPTNNQSIVKKNGTWLDNSSNAPFSGDVVWEQGKIVWEEKFTNGIRSSLKGWDEDGTQIELYSWNQDGTPKLNPHAYPLSLTE
tara:strand:- start:44 stop:511 length:468 start_codon:yes stop_codon:yes gene_type:complete